MAVVSSPMNAMAHVLLLPDVCMHGLPTFDSKCTM
jgi:hypothetical protein